MPRNTKASRILNDAAMRLEAARMRRHTAQSQLNSAIATYDALQEAYDALEKELAPKPRARASSAQTAPAKPATTKAPKVERNGHRCTYKYTEDSPVYAGMVCDEFFENGIHDETIGYVGYHPFSLTAQSAEKKSRRKAAVANSTPSTETNSEGALAVGAGGD